MSGSETADYARELDNAREREFDSLLEQEFAGEPPVAAILKRAESGVPAVSRKPARSWLAAALVLLGIGVAVAIAWDARLEREDHNTATPQDPTPVDMTWPDDVPRIYSFDKMSTVPDGATHLSLSMAASAARDFSRLTGLQHLEVKLTPSSIGKLVKAGGGVEEGTRLDVLATAKGLRRLSIAGVPMAAADFGALRHLQQLQVLELGPLFEINEELLAAMTKGGKAIGRPFSREMGEAIATSSRAKNLRLTGLPLTAKGLRALAGAELHSLIIDGPHDVTPEVLQVLGELKTLRRLELRSVHAESLSVDDGGSIARGGTRALTAAVMQSIASLPVLHSLTLDLCFLDRDVVAALPRHLRRLDVSSCFDVDGSLVDAVLAMPDLRDVGLPIQMKDDKGFMSMWRPPIRGTNLHTRRLTADQAATIIGSRVWQSLRLDGQLTKAVADELAAQIGLQALTLTISPGSESLAFTSQLPKLSKVTFANMGVTVEMMQPLNDCTPLRSVGFDSCLVDRERVTNRLGLRADLAVRWGYRAVW